jgi:hypothetical protein
MKYFFGLLCTLVCSLSLRAQYAPQAGVAGSTAISQSSSVFVRWADQCTVQRGYMNIDSPALGYTSFGDSTMALGMPDHSIVSLGDSGVATMHFPGVIYNGPGPDFAVFENGFINPANDSAAFLELAFVEVSSDGINYQRFPANSLTPINSQIPGSGVYMYANLINGLAGKYGAGYGTPFDLDDLPPVSYINKSAITDIRIVDVIGDVTRHATRDSAGRIINDPYPTQFPTGGFDLDAVGVIHYTGGTGIGTPSANANIRLYPMPVTDRLYIDATTATPATLTDVSGRVLATTTLIPGRNEVDMQPYAAGIYLLITYDNNNARCVARVIKR